MNRREFLSGFLTLLATSSASCRSINNFNRKPNILFIIVDQQRQDGIGAYGIGHVKTPHLNKIAAQGVLFPRAYVAQPVCAPNRASLWSGLYPFNHGVRENTWDLNPKIELLPHFLAKEGYSTAYFGKWHLGDDSRSAFQVMPTYEDDGRGTGHYFQRDGKRIYQTEVLANDVGSFIKENKDNPFFAVVSMYPPHPPYSVPKEYENIYQDIYPEDKQRRLYYGMCSAIDDAVGNINHTLDSLNLEKDTLVIYTSDHGHLFDLRWNNHNKRVCYEEAAKIPLLMKYPRLIPSAQKNQMLINSVDLSPTILGFIGYSEPVSFDGADLSSFILGESNEEPNHTVFINVPFMDDSGPPPSRPMLERGEERCIVYENWKLILSTARSPELYDLENDPAEKHNLWATGNENQVVEILINLLKGWGLKTDDVLTPQLTQNL